MGCPIRISADHRLLASPRSFSQRATSFIASQCQGIHQMLLSRLITRTQGQAPARFVLAWCYTFSTKTWPHTSTYAAMPSVSLLCPTRPCDPVRPKKTFLLYFLSSLVQHPAHKRVPPSMRSFFSLFHLPHASASEWWRRSGSNRRPQACKARALPAELRPQKLVGQGGFEPPTSRLSSARSNQLSY